MGFNKVYRSLQEVFPQLDARVLRAVAIEHSKDADAAVEAVLLDIIPFFNGRSRPNTSLSGKVSVGESSQAPRDGTTIADTADGKSVCTEDSTEAQLGYNVTDGDQQSLNDADDGNNEPIYDTYDAHCDNGHALQTQGSNDVQTEETFSSDKFPESSVKMLAGNIPRQTLGTLQDFDDRVSQNVNSLKDMIECDDLKTELKITVNNEDEYEKSSEQGNTSAVGAASLIVDDQSANIFESSVQLGVINEIHRSDLEDLKASLSNDTGSQGETGISTVRSEDANLSDSMSQASQMHIIEVLEQVIADARNNKTTLFSTMQSVINLMKEVEFKEQAAEQAKVEASMGGNDILVKVEELKQMIEHAKEANNMHAGEVYGERSILASELRELQSRVLSLSDERDKSLAVLDEMRHALEVRLAEAENDIKSAEQSKVEKEKVAMEALANEELIMEKVVLESKILEQQAKENAKLQEFLVDRGRIIDMLQGEIAVVCQDVRLLKEKFNDHIPYSKLLSSSQTSCISASSISSLNGSSPKEVDPVSNGASVSALNGSTLPVPDDTFDSFKMAKRDPVAEQSSEDKGAKDDAKALLEDGWELCDM